MAPVIATSVSSLAYVRPPVRADTCSSVCVVKLPGTPTPSAHWPTVYTAMRVRAKLADNARRDGAESNHWFPTRGNEAGTPCEIQTRLLRPGNAAIEFPSSFNAL